jgi:hypothetical protein
MRRTSAGSQPPPITVAELWNLLRLTCPYEDPPAALERLSGLLGPPRMNADYKQVRQLIYELLSSVLWIDQTSVELLLEALDGIPRHARLVSVTFGSDSHQWAVQSDPKSGAFKTARKNVRPGRHRQAEPGMVNRNRKNLTASLTSLRVAVLEAKRSVERGDIVRGMARLNVTWGYHEWLGVLSNDQGWLAVTGIDGVLRRVSKRPVSIIAEHRLGPIVLAREILAAWLNVSVDAVKKAERADKASLTLARDGEQSTVIVPSG